MAARSRATRRKTALTRPAACCRRRSPRARRTDRSTAAWSGTSRKRSCAAPVARRANKRSSARPLLSRSARARRIVPRWRNATVAMARARAASRAGERPGARLQHIVESDAAAKDVMDGLPGQPPGGKPSDRVGRLDGRARLGQNHSQRGFSPRARGAVRCRPRARKERRRGSRSGRGPARRSLRYRQAPAGRRCGSPYSDGSRTGCPCRGR